MEKIVLYTTHCPKCTILERKLKMKNISYEIFDNLEKMLERGFTSVPVLEVDNNTMLFEEASQWIKNKDVV